MVTLVAGAVAVGIVSVCAIPFGCFISRKFKKKVIVPPEVLIETEVEDPDQEPNSGSESESVEVVGQSDYQIEEMRSRSNNRRVPRVEIRVLVSDGSTRTEDIPSQGYITASGTSGESSSRQNRAFIQAVEARRVSLENFASGPAADRENEVRNSSVPMAARMREYSVQSSQSEDTTRLEITISGAFHKSVAHFGEFKDDVPETSTPKSKAKPAEEPNLPKTSFWRRASADRNGPPKIFKTTRDIEVINIEVIPEEESRQRRNFEPLLATEAKAEANCITRNESRKSQMEARVPSQENGAACDRGRWGLPSRFFESFRETTSFATL